MKNKIKLLMFFSIIVLLILLKYNNYSYSSPASSPIPCLNAPSVSNIIPGDTPLTNQVSLNCFAWQEFIGLNWPTKKNSGASDFGNPLDYSPVVFETYKTTHDLFQFKGKKPPKWSDSSNVNSVHRFNHTSKFGDKFDPGDIQEAFPSPAWLADKNGNLVWYEIFVNEPEYNYFYENEYYKAQKQFEAASHGIHIDLPKGDLSGKVGAMEIKTAWLTVNDPANPKWKRYKLSKAKFCNDHLSGCTNGIVALVGIHIIHKTVSQPSWIWATFEHVDNSPDIEEAEKGSVAKDYNFFSNSCKEIDIPAKCVEGVSDKKTSCEYNIPPAYEVTLKDGKPVGECKPYPIQVVREYPIPNTNENPVKSINEHVHNLIKQSNPDSVYQYYELVNVLWNDSTIDENAENEDKSFKPPVNSLSKTGFRPNPNAFPVANTVLETYIQNTTCISCHSGATIANPNNYKPNYASDYSFLFGNAPNIK